MKPKNKLIKVPNAVDTIEKIDIKTLVLPNRSLRRHNDKKIVRLAGNIQAFGFVVPILVDHENRVIAGAARVKAAKSIGMNTIPAVRVDHLSEAELRAFRIADNKLVELSQWDEIALRDEILTITELDPEIDLDLIAFDTAEIDRLLSIDLVEESPALDADDDMEDVESEVVSRAGDIWLLGSHRLMCGDSTDKKFVSNFLDGRSLDLIATDPPYNVPIEGHVRTSGSSKHREFLQASGEMTSGEFANFLKQSFAPSVEFLRNGGVLYVFMDWRSIETLLRVGRELELKLLNLAVWNKTNGGMGSFYRSKHELCAIFKKGNEPHTNNVQLGSTGRYRTNVWDYAGVNAFGHDRKEALKIHPTVKPVAMVIDLIKDSTKRGATIMDPFVGSGSTLIAAEKVGRIGLGMDIDPRYIDASIRRFNQRFGIEATHQETGLTFSEMQQLRELNPSKEPTVAKNQSETEVEPAFDSRSGQSVHRPDKASTVRLRRRPPKIKGAGSEFASASNKQNSTLTKQPKKGVKA